MVNIMSKSLIKLYIISEAATDAATYTTPDCSVWTHEMKQLILVLCPLNRKNGYPD